MEEKVEAKTEAQMTKVENVVEVHFNHSRKTQNIASEYERARLVERKSALEEDW
jgi:hypothetical protein